MKSFKSLFASCLLVAILAVAGFAQSVPTLSALTVVNQLSTTCTLNQQVVLQAQGGAYSSGQSSGLYTCVQSNVWQKYSQTADTLEVLSGDFTNATATAATILSFPINPNGNYKFQCTLFYANSGATALVATVTTPASPTNVLAFSQIYSTNSGTNTAGVLTSSPLAFTGATVAGGATVFKATIEGTIENGATAGTLAFQGSTASGTLTVKRGSFCSMN